MVAEGLGGALFGQLFLRCGEEVLVLVEAPGGAHPRPVARDAKLPPAVPFAGVGGGRLGGRGGAAELLTLGADLRGGVGQGACGEVRVDIKGPLEKGAERAHLAAGGAARTLGAGVGVPGAGEVGDGSAGAVAMGGEHRADAPRGGVDVSADDDAIGFDAAEHGLFGGLRQPLDGEAKVVCGALASVSHGLRCSAPALAFWLGERVWGEKLQPAGTAA